MLVERINEDMKRALKAGDRIRLGAIRMLRAAIKDKEIELGRPLAESEIHALIAKLIKQRREAVEQYVGAGRSELAAKEAAEIEVLTAYLPAPLSEAEIDALLAEAIAATAATGPRDMGKVMAWLRPRVQGRAEMAALSAKVRQALAER